MHMYVFMCIYIYELHIFFDFNIPKSTASAMTPFFSPCQVPHTRRLLLTSRRGATVRATWASENGFENGAYPKNGHLNWEIWGFLPMDLGNHMANHRLAGHHSVFDKWCSRSSAICGTKNHFRFQTHRSGWREHLFWHASQIGGYFGLQFYFLSF